VGSLLKDPDVDNRLSVVCPKVSSTIYLFLRARMCSEGSSLAFLSKTYHRYTFPSASFSLSLPSLDFLFLPPRRRLLPDYGELP